jgi:hypothetical protein
MTGRLRMTLTVDTRICMNKLQQPQLLPSQRVCCVAYRCLDKAAIVVPATAAAAVGAGLQLTSRAHATSSSSKDAHHFNGSSSSSRAPAAQGLLGHRRVGRKGRPPVSVSEVEETKAFLGIMPLFLCIIIYQMACAFYCFWFCLVFRSFFLLTE